VVQLEFYRCFCTHIDFVFTFSGAFFQTNFNSSILGGFTKRLVSHLKFRFDSQSTSNVNIKITFFLWPRCGLLLLLKFRRNCLCKLLPIPESRHSWCVVWILQLEVIIFSICFFTSWFAEAAEMENSKFKSSWLNRCLTIVVFPDPEGAENTINFPPCSFFYFLFP
jgi:hypothetical protein